ncbi:MAG: DUF748 domain-containing protein [Pseudomonadota bacterium]|nr:DUF748 domain-containing protein [Pseudomonadota bacterium]
MFRFLFRQIVNYKWSFSLLTLILLIVSLLPTAIKTGIQYTFKQQGADQVEINNVDFNLFTGHFSLQNLTVHSQQNSVLSVDLVDIKLDLSALFNQHLLIEKIELNNATIRAKHSDQQLEFAGFSIPLEQEQSEQSSTELPIDFGIQSLHFNDLKLTLDTPNQSVKQTQYAIRHLYINELLMWESNPAELILTSQLNQSMLNAHLWLHLFNQDPKIIGTIKTHDLNIAEMPYLAELSPVQAVAKITTDITFTAEKKLGALHYEQQGNIAVQQAKIESDPYQAAFNSFEWSGDVRFIQEGANPEAKLHGLLKLDNFKAQDIQSNTLIEHSLNTQLDLLAQVQPNGVLLTQKGAINLQNVLLQQPPYQLKLKDLNWQGNLKIDADQETKITSISTLKIADLHATDGQSQISHDLSSKLDLEVNLTEDGLVVLQAGDIQVANISASQPPYQANLESLSWQGSLALKQDDTIDLNSQGNMALNALDITHNLQNLAQLEKLTIQKLVTKELNNIKVTNLNLTNLDIAKQNKLPFVHLEQASINQAWLPEPLQLIIGHATFTNSETQLTLNKQGKPVEIEALLKKFKSTAVDPSVQASSDKDQTTIDSSKEKPFNFQWGRIELNGEHNLNLLANQFEPAIKKQVKLEQLLIGKLDSHKPTQDTSISLKITLDEFTHISSEGVIQPLNPALYAKLESELQGINLIDLSPATAKFIGYNINSGQLNALLKMEVANNKINAENDLKIHKLDLETANNEESKEFDNSLSMPIDAALSLLRDKQDNIKLKLPIKGNLNDPNFEIKDIINTALSGALKKATKTYLLLALQPFGAIALVGDMVLDKAGAIQLQAISFTPGKIELSADMHAYLNKLNTLLQERKGVQIKACGIANESDRQVLLALSKLAAQKIQEKNSDSKTTPAVPLVTDDTLLALAKQRGEVIKRQLLKLGTKTSQVILCQPELQPNNETPRVALGI